MQVLLARLARASIALHSSITRNWSAIFKSFRSDRARAIVADATMAGAASPVTRTLIIATRSCISFLFRLLWPPLTPLTDANEPQPDCIESNGRDRDAELH